MKDMNIAIIGYGKMGKAIEKLAADRGHNIVAIIDEENSPKWHDLNAAAVDVAIEFSSPESALDHIFRCANLRIPCVCGTTGWLQHWDRAVKKITETGSALFYASNYSLGVNILFEMNKRLGDIMAQFPSYAVQINETHHTEKKDSPSGTAISLAEGLKKEWSLDNPEPGKLPIYAFRAPEVFGIHEVIYKSQDDEIMLRHEAHNRNGFAGGSLVAAQWILNKTGIFGMKDLLSF